MTYADFVALMKRIYGDNWLEFAECFEPLLKQEENT